MKPEKKSLEKVIPALETIMTSGSMFFISNFDLDQIGEFNDPTWMSQEASKCLVNGLFHLLTNRVFLGVITH